MTEISFYDKITETNKNKLIKELNLIGLTELANEIKINGIPNKVYVSKDLKNSLIISLFSYHTYVYTHELLPNNKIAFYNTFHIFNVKSLDFTYN